MITQQCSRECPSPTHRMPRAAGYHWKKLVFSLDLIFRMGHSGPSPISSNHLLVLWGFRNTLGMWERREEAEAAGLGGAQAKIFLLNWAWGLVVELR